MPSPRRSISEAPGLATLSRLSGDKVVEEDEEEGDGGDHMGLGMSDMRLAASHGGEERRPGIGRRRRHSFNVVQDAPEPWQVLSRSVLWRSLSPRSKLTVLLTHTF